MSYDLLYLLPFWDDIRWEKAPAADLKGDEAMKIIKIILVCVCVWKTFVWKKALAAHLKYGKKKRK